MRPDDDDLNEEIRGHLAISIKERIDRGEDPTSARLAARKEFGNVTLTRDSMRSVWSNRWLDMVDTVAQDVRFALRSLRRAKGLASTVVLTLALGIGANTAIFSVVRGVLFKPLPNREGDRLMYLRQSIDGPGGADIGFSVPEVNDFRTGAKSLGAIAEYSPWAFTMQGEDGAVRVEAGLVTGNFFDVMGLSPVLGRLTRPSDDGPGVAPVMVLTHDYWMKRFGGDSSIVGRQVKLDGASVTVIGVLQRAPFFPGRVDALFNMVVSDAPHERTDGAGPYASHDRDGRPARARSQRRSSKNRGRRRLRTHAGSVQRGVRSRIALPRRRHPVQGSTR